MKSIMLIVFPLVLMVFVGILYNSYNNASFGVGNGSCFLLGYACTISNYTPSQNNFADNSFQVLNPASPFTMLLTGRISDFVFALFNNQPSYNFGACIDCSQSVSCTSTNTGYLCNNFYVVTQANQCNYPPIMMYDGFHPLNFTDPQGNNSIWNIYGASATIDSNCNPHLAQNTGYYTGVVSAFCYVHTNSANQHLITCSPPSSVSPTNAFAGIFGFFSFIAGILLFIIGLGINFSASALASGISFGSNAQGSKLAQTFGLFMLLFGFLFSEFGSWFFVLPYGMGYMLLATLLIISGVGIFWRSQSYD